MNIIEKIQQEIGALVWSGHALQCQLDAANDRIKELEAKLAAQAPPAA